jgi:hypothetical protein
MATDANSKISTQYTVGLNHVGAYQAAGTPWLSSSLMGANPGKGSTKVFELPAVAKSITVSVVSPRSLLSTKPEVSEDIFVYFGESKTEAGTVVDGYDSFTVSNNATWPAAIKQGHIRPLQLSQSLNVGARVRTVNIGFLNGSGTGLTGAVTVYAELTNIPSGRMADNYISGAGVNTY